MRADLYGQLWGTHKPPWGLPNAAKCLHVAAMRAIAVELALRLLPDWRPVTYACPISPVLCIEFMTVSVCNGLLDVVNLQEWVFAVVLFHASPAKLPRKIKNWCEQLTVTEALSLISHSCRCLLEQRRIKRCSETNWGGPDCAIISEAV